MEELINQKEEYNIYKKISNLNLIVKHKHPLEFSRNNPETLLLEKQKINLFTQKCFYNNKNNKNENISMNNSSLYNNHSSQNNSPLDIKSINKNRKFMKSLDNQIIKERQKLNKVNITPDKNKVKNNSNDDVSDYKIYLKFSALKDKMLNKINFRKPKQLNIKTINYKHDEFRRNRNYKILKPEIHEIKSIKEKKLNDLNAYPKIKKVKAVFDYKNNIINNMTTTLKSNLSTNNINGINQTNYSPKVKILKFDILNESNQKVKEGNINFSSIDNKKVILKKPIRNLKTLNINNINKLPISKEIIIPKLTPNYYKISQNEVSFEIIGNLSSSNININNSSNILNTLKNQIPNKDNNNQSNLISPMNKLNPPIRLSLINKKNEIINKRIFNADTNSIKTISSKDEENNSIAKNDNQSIKLNLDSENDNDSQKSKKSHKKDNNNHVKFNVFKGRKRTKIQHFVVKEMKGKNKFLEQISILNKKFPGKEDLLLHLIKLDKKYIISNQVQKISKMIKSNQNKKDENSSLKEEINSLKIEYINYCENNIQNPENVLQSFVPSIIRNLINKCYLSRALSKKILTMTEFSTIFVPIVDISFKRKTVVTGGKLFLIEQRKKIFQDQKSKSIRYTLPKNLFESMTFNLIGKELSYISIDSNEHNDSIDSYTSYGYFKAKSEKHVFFNVSSPNKNAFGLTQKKKFKRKRTISAEKIISSQYMERKGVRTISILEKNDFFNVKNKTPIKDDDNLHSLYKINNKNRFMRRRNDIIDSSIFEKLSDKNKFEKIVRNINNKGKADHFKILKELIKKSEVLLFIEYFNKFGKNIDINRVDEYGNSLLILAIRQGLDTISRMLIKNNIDVDAQNVNGNSALHYALSGKNYKIADELIKLGADENCKNNSGLAPWDCIGKSIDEY